MKKNNFFAKIFDHKLFKNKDGLVRSGWIIAPVIIVFYFLAYIVPLLTVEILKAVFIKTGDINAVTGDVSPLVIWMDDIFLPIALQILTDILMLLIPIIAWRCILKKRLSTIGLNALAKGWKDAVAGLLLGFCSVTFVLILVTATGNARMEFRHPEFNSLTLWWTVTFIFVAFAEEILSRGFLMSVLRRSQNKYLIIFFPAFFFSAVHAMNPNVSLLPFTNIFLIGLVFGYIYYKSGSLWMCIGYHFTWNTFQGVVYGIPVSGLDCPSIFQTEILGDNLWNGGAFGLEGGFATTIGTLFVFLFVFLYYRNSKYNFIHPTPNGR